MWSNMWDALHAAVRGSAEIVNDFLIDERGAPIINSEDECEDEDDGCTPLHAAARDGEVEMVRLLLLNGAEIDALDENDWTPLYVGTYFGHVAASLALVEAGADVNIRCGAHERSVVHMAAQEGEVEILRAVIEHGADVNVADMNRNTPLHAAATADLTSESIDVLLEAGANTEAKDLGGCTPLHNATVQYSLDGLRALLKHGANIDDTNLQLRTPLVFAASHAGEPGAVEMVDFLLKSGADETIVDDQGRAAVDVVGWLTEDYDDDVERDVEHVRQLLENAPADRAWRRRGYLALCRAHPDRLQRGLGQDGGSTHPGIAPRTRNQAGQERAERSGTVDGSTGGEWAGVVAKVLDVKEEGLFRAIVEYL